jgi:proteasome lid subunit RPN8/RPN11
MLVLVGLEFPFSPPTLWFQHKRFAGTPHVQWGRFVCLYQSVEVEWKPADGMYGFFERVDSWLAAAGAGLLDPEDAPLHPPVAYSEASTKVVIGADAPATDGQLWMGRADLMTKGPQRRDLVGWVSLDDWDAVAVRGTPAIAILLNSTLPFEFPTGVYDLLNSIEQAGVPFGLIFSTLKLVAALVPEGEPGHLILGAPMRRKAAGEPLRQHLTVWEIDADSLGRVRAYAVGGEDEAERRQQVAEWMVTAKVGWCTVLENRPEVVNRRDKGATAEAMTGRRVALLGCGALGSAVAEMIVRAGATRLRLIDNAIVRPGLLVRQRFSDADIALGKAASLKHRLDGLGLGCEIDIDLSDLKGGVLARLEGLEPDLVIDATASRGVAHRLEVELDVDALPCPIISMSVSAAAANGSVLVRMPTHSGGVLAVERAAKLVAFARDRGHPLVEAFWPEHGGGAVFQPEPGCSNPTFTGSAADVDHHAAGLLNVGLRRVQELLPTGASMDLVAPPWSDVGSKVARLLRYVLPSAEITREHNRGYRVFTSQAAQRGMASEIRRIARTRSSKFETGGLLFGDIDDSHSRVFIDGVSGPPSDSEMSPERFLCGTAGTVALAARRRAVSGGTSRLIGIWHTHPVSRGQPSEEDLLAMVQLLHLQPKPPRQVAMLIVGFAESRPDPKVYVFHRDDFRVVRVADLPYARHDA